MTIDFKTFDFRLYDFRLKNTPFVVLVIRIENFTFKQ